MQVRHRIPTIFSIYMVDVLCCALGCVVLLWQLYHYESEEQTARANQSQTELKSTNTELEAALAKLRSTNLELEAARDKLKLAHLSIESLSSEVSGLKVALATGKKREITVTLQLEDSRKERDRLEKLLIVSKKDYDELKMNHSLVEAMLANSRSEFKLLKQKSTLTADQLADKIKAHAELMDKLAGVEKRVTALEKELAVKKGDLLASLKKADDLDKLWKTSADRTRALEKHLAQLRLESRDNLAKLNLAEARARLLDADLEKGKKSQGELSRRLQDLLKDRDNLSGKLLVSSKDLENAKLTLVAVESDRDTLKGKLMVSLKELADAKLLVGSLQGDRTALIKQNQTLRSEADNRFAGIALTGTRVLFLVDMSGSMELIDEKTADPDKWPLVCEIIGKLMKSLPEIKEYQVILFSDKVRYPLANEGRWLSYNPEQSPRMTVDALKATKPKGETNLYSAFEEAFKFRPEGMDAIYVFSDGLPNAGPGLPANSSQLSDQQQAEALAKHLRGRLKFWNRPVEGHRVKINTIGFFFESPDVGAFLWALARENDGSFVGMSRP